MDIYIFNLYDQYRLKML